MLGNRARSTPPLINQIVQLNSQGIQIKNEYDEIDHQMNEGQLTLQNLKEVRLLIKVNRVLEPAQVAAQ